MLMNVKAGNKVYRNPLNWKQSGGLGAKSPGRRRPLGVRGQSSWRYGDFTAFQKYTFFRHSLV